MMSAASPSGFSFALAAIATVVCLSTATAQSLPDAENGRYTMSPVADGVLRLDTRTGEMSTCSNNGNGWACYTVPDERAALDTEIGRLQADNEKLKARLAAQEPATSGKIDEALPKSDSLKPPEPKVADSERKIEIPKIEIPLPSDRDMDRMMSFVEQAWRRLVDMANRMQKDVGGRI